MNLTVMNSGLAYNESSLCMSSMQIAELTGKQHSHVLQDIDKIINELGLNRFSDGVDSELNPDSDGVSSAQDSEIFELKTKKSKRGAVRYFDLNQEAALLLVSGYNVKLRRAILSEWRMYKEAFYNSKWKHNDVEIQKRVMSSVKRALSNHAVALDYIKANTIVNKAVSNLFGFEKMVKKDDMSQPMLEERQRILENFEKLFSVKPDYTWVKEAIYSVEKPKRLTFVSE